MAVQIRADNVNKKQLLLHLSALCEREEKGLWNSEPWDTPSAIFSPVMSKPGLHWANPALFTMQTDRRPEADYG